MRAQTPPFLTLRDADGLRHVIRLTSIASLHDVDQTQSDTLIQLHGGRVLRIPIPLDEAVGWLGGYVDAGESRIGS